MEDISQILGKLDQLEKSQPPRKPPGKAKLPHLDFGFDLVQSGDAYLAQIPRLRPPMVPEKPTNCPTLATNPFQLPVMSHSSLEQVVEDCLSVFQKDTKTELRLPEVDITFEDIIEPTLIHPHFAFYLSRGVNPDDLVLHEAVGYNLFPVSHKQDASSSNSLALPKIFCRDDTSSVGSLNPSLISDDGAPVLSGADELDLLDSGKDLYDRPAGFDRGIQPLFKGTNRVLNKIHERAKTQETSEGRSLKSKRVLIANKMEAPDTKANLTKRFTEKLFDVAEIELMLNSSEIVINSAPQAGSASDSSPKPAVADLQRRSSLDELLAIENIPAPGTQGGTKSSKYLYAIEEKLKFQNISDVIPDMAMEYPFKLDAFQEEAIYRVENHQHVFVAAHTSAGKTVVAEYAIASALKHMTKAVYTSPIKALSNQKFREFKSTFGDVGLLTGDVSINPTASCLIMTTEILRLHLYKGSDLIRDLEYVIFDEIHYVNDAERGVVWEEVLIMLPEHITLVMLSATVPNVMDFADWVGRLNKKQVYVVSTAKRPVPLDFHLFYNNAAFQIFQTGQSEINRKGYNDAMDAYKAKNEKSKNGPRQFSRHSGPNADGLSKFINFLKTKELLPSVIFVFSKKKCDEYAGLLSKTDLTTSSEKSQVEVFVTSCLTKLPESDRHLPQIKTIKANMKRGIGVHHSGLLPIVREMVEILFSRGIVKVLFATETFAMGVNMPAKSVAFVSIRKHDGKEFRNLLAGEFIQMSGRAGRRGLDRTGTVLLCCWGDITDMTDLQSIMIKDPIPLSSQFRITYNMILNLHRVDDIKVEDMIRKSFSELHSQRGSIDYRRKLERAEAKLSSVKKVECIMGEPEIDHYYELSSTAQAHAAKVNEAILANKSAASHLTTGRVVLVNTQEMRNGYAVLMDGGPIKNGIKTYRAVAFNKTISKVIHVKVHEIMKITTVMIKVDAKSKPQDLPAYYVQEARKRAAPKGEPYPPLSASKDLKMTTLDFMEMYSNLQSYTKRLETVKCHTCPILDEHYESNRIESFLTNFIIEHRSKLSDSGLGLMPDYSVKVQVLKRLGYMKEDESLTLKGRVSAEFRSPRCELIATELIFRNILINLSAAEIAAVLSCLIFEERGEEEETAFSSLKDATESVFAITEELAQLQKAMGVSFDHEEYLSIPNFRMADAVYEWASGVPFAKLKDFTPVMEGSIVRCIIRLSEFCKEMKNAARIMGDFQMHEKIEKVLEIIKRDIVFAASLYVA